MWTARRAASAASLGFSSLRPLGRLVVETVKTARHVVLLDKVGIRAPVNVERHLACLLIRIRRIPHSPECGDLGLPASNRPSSPLGRTRRKSTRGH